MTHIYANTKHDAFHLSVGMIVLDDAGRVLVLERPDGTITLPTGTQQPGETLVNAVHRELREETGAHGDITRFLGSTVMPFTWKGAGGFVYDKTFLWHQMTLGSIDPARRDADDDEADAVVRFIAPGELRAIFIAQGRRLGDWDFSLALDRLGTPGPTAGA